MLLPFSAANFAERLRIVPDIERTTKSSAAICRDLAEKGWVYIDSKRPIKSAHGEQPLSISVSRTDCLQGIDARHKMAERKCLE